MNNNAIKKYLLALIALFVFSSGVKAQVTMAYKKVATDTNLIVYDEQGHGLRYYQYTKLVNSGDYGIRYNGRPGDPGVQGHLKKLTDADKAQFLAIMKERMSIRTDKLKDGSILDITPLQDALHGVDFRDKVIVLVFWNSGCPPCTENFASINNIFSQLPNQQDVVLVALTTENKEAAAAKLGAKPLLNALEITNSSGINTTYGISKLPSYVVTDKDHIIRLALAGASPMTSTAIKTTVMSALAK